MKRLLLLIVTFFSVLSANAQFNAPYPVWQKRTGNWTDPTGWSTGKVPDRDVTVGIQESCEVIVTTEVFSGNIYVEEKGTLNIAQTGTLHINRANTYGGIKLLLHTKLIVSGKLLIGDISRLNGDGIQAAFADFNFAEPDVLVNETGQISIDNTEGSGIMFISGTITNKGKIEIGKSKPIGLSENKNVTSFGFYAEWGVTVTNSGVITVDNVKNLPGLPVFSGMAVTTLINTGQVRIGEQAGISDKGLLVSDSIYNAGVISIDNAQHGLGARQIDNSGQIKIGQLGRIAGQGIYSPGTATLINRGDIMIDNTGSDAIRYDAGSITNYKNVVIGSKNAVGGSALALTGAALSNEKGGKLQVQNCGNHLIRMGGNATFFNTGITDVAGNGGTKTDGIYVGNATFTNNIDGQLKLDNVKKSGIHLVSGRFGNRGTLTLMKTDTIPVLLQAGSSFDNSGTFDASAANGTYGGCVAITGGSRFNNNGGTVILDRSAPSAILPALFVSDTGSMFINNGLLTIGNASTPFPHDAVQLADNAFFSNERGGILKVISTRRSGIKVLDESEVNNIGTMEFYDVTESPVYAIRQSKLGNDGIIKTGLGPASSRESIFLGDHVHFTNQAHGEIHINKASPGPVGLMLRDESEFNNDGKIVWGSDGVFQGTSALRLMAGSLFHNGSRAILEFVGAAADAIACDATSVPGSSRFINDGTVRFGNVKGRGLYISDNAFVFLNNSIFETMPGGTMTLVALFSNSSSGKVNNTDGTVNLSHAFDNRGNIANGGTFNSRAVTNGGTIVNNGTWNATDVFTNNSRYQGSGTFKGALFSNKAEVAPGNSPGCTDFGNGFNAQGSLTIEVNGETACTQFDQITVNGTAQLSGKLNVTFAPGYTPTAYASITILKASAISGTFTGNNLPAGWSVVYDKPATGDVTLVSASALPLRLMQFTVQREGSAAVASWATTEEVNTSHFDLERSADGKQFMKVATIDAANAAGEHVYSFTDHAPLSGLSYYRLKMVDLPTGGSDNPFTYSRIVAFNGNTVHALITAIYPNPAQRIVTLETSGSSHQTIEVVSQAGRAVLHTSIPAPGVQTLDVSTIPPGIYIIKVGDGEVHKLIKQ